MNTYGLRFADGDVDIVGTDLAELKEHYQDAKIMERLGYPAYAGVEPVFLAGTNPGDYQWEALDTPWLVA